MKKPDSSDKEAEQLVAELDKTRQLLNKLKEEQRIRNNEQEHFAYVVSHDLKSPLASIVLTSEMLRENFGDAIDEGNDQLLQVLNRATFKIRNLADGILSYYRAERAMNEPPETFNLSACVQMIVETLRPGLSAEIHYPQEGALIHANKSALEQILGSLMHNAIRYNNKEKTILYIRFLEDEMFYYFEVQDNGKGIPVEDQQRIFDLFTSLGDDRSGIPGLGIGLSNVKKLVENEGGKIRVHSVLQEGSLFQFSLKKSNTLPGA
ncbi:MAG: HAMP domain-containing sensor histidine kinase [Bacteroidota bacterium]|nr:HAMP domain-containing sensor histidine kinase [Bacteroidota bacterium]